MYFSLHRGTQHILWHPTFAKYHEISVFQRLGSHISVLKTTNVFVIIGLKIQPIAMSLDNYGYLVTDQRTGTAVLVDPADVDRVQVSACMDKQFYYPVKDSPVLVVSSPN